MTSDFLSINDVTNEELTDLITAADAYGRRSADGTPLAGKNVAMLFEKPSLRTKVSFDIAVYELGGHAIFLGKDEVDLDSREQVEDVARVLERWASVIVARVNSHGTLTRLAEHSSVPVVNALSDVEHPCQAVADLLTIQQHLGRLDGIKVAYVGDANNCALSLGLGCAATGGRFAIASPRGYAFDDESLGLIAARGVAPEAGMDPALAVAGADVIYTDAWTSMGQEAEAAERRTAFQGFQVDAALLAKANPGALLMHPMPVHYGEELPAGMLDHPQAVAFDQAENRLHAQKAVLRLLITGE
ncbi:MAG: ornithine carbamoyltransferase [Dehalococcoidia bacterium]